MKNSKVLIIMQSASPPPFPPPFSSFSRMILVDFQFSPGLRGKIERQKVLYHVAHKVLPSTYQAKVVRYCCYYFNL